MSPAEILISADTNISALHNLSADKPRVYIGPAYWRSRGDNWSYEYNLRDFGLLKKPALFLR